MVDSTNHVGNNAEWQTAFEIEFACFLDHRTAKPTIADSKTAPDRAPILER
jgi:hypothetical protein